MKQLEGIWEFLSAKRRDAGGTVNYHGPHEPKHYTRRKQRGLGRGRTFEGGKNR